MTGARSWAIPALVVALICALGAGVVFLLRPRAPSPGPAQVAAQLIDQVDLTNLAALNEELPEGSKAVVMGGPAPLAAGAPESSTAPTAARPASPIPAPSRQVSPPGDQDEPHPVQTGEVLATETAGAAGAPPPPTEPAPAAVPPVGAVTRVEDGTALAEVLDGLPENYDVATAVRSQDRLLLAVAMPRSFYPTWNPALIVVTAVTGLLAALAVLLLSRQRDRSVYVRRKARLALAVPGPAGSVRAGAASDGTRLARAAATARQANPTSAAPDRVGDDRRGSAGEPGARPEPAVVATAQYGSVGSPRPAENDAGGAGDPAPRVGGSARPAAGRVRLAGCNAPGSGRSTEGRA